MRVTVIVVFLIALVSTTDAQVLTVGTTDRDSATANTSLAATSTQPDATADLRDLVGFDASFDATTQGAGTPNRGGLSAFIPLRVGENRVIFATVSGYGTFPGFAGTSVRGGSPGTGSRVGYRWLNADRTWMYGITVGYDSRGLRPTVPSWRATTGSDRTNATFGQAALGVETVGERWDLEATAVVGVGNVAQRITAFADAGVLDTHSTRVGYHLRDDTVVSVSYYYQESDLDVAGSGVLAGVEHQLTPILTARLAVSHDHAFDTRVSGGIRVGFGRRTTHTQRATRPFQALSRKPQAVVRIHHAAVAGVWADGFLLGGTSGAGQDCFIYDTFIFQNKC